MGTDSVSVWYALALFAVGFLTTSLVSGYFLWRSSNEQQRASALYAIQQYVVYALRAVLSWAKEEQREPHVHAAADWVYDNLVPYALKSWIGRGEFAALVIAAWRRWAADETSVMITAAVRKAAA